LRLVAIGDIHGQAWKLRELLTKVHELPLADDDRLVFLGDYVDRGPEVRLTIDILLRLRDERPNTIFLRGNHEQEMMDYRDLSDPRRGTRRNPEDLSWWPAGGGRETMEAYGGGPRWYEGVPCEHWEFIEQTLFEHREGGYIFVHAGLVPPGCRWNYQEDPRLWIREEFINSIHDFGGTVLYGHTPLKNGRPLVMRNKIGIDTGAAYGGWITAAVLTPHDPKAVRFLQA
jgi:serine/threonine protein phosphatase 1